MIDLMYSLLILIFISLSVNGNECAAPLHAPPDKRTFTIGVLANRDVESTFREYTKTFREYLSLVAGAKFDPPLKFDIVPVPFGEPDPLDVFVSRSVDFTFTNPALFSCIESETSASSILTQITRRNAGQSHNLTGFGGVIFTLADNDEINHTNDIKGKRVGLASMSSLGSGQMQFRELLRKGIHHLQDPKQSILMVSQDRVVQSLLKGEIDVGYVRTDQLERTVNENTGERIDLSRIKIIGAKENLVNQGNPFPFKSSTELYPEWNVAGFDHVPDDVIQAVQSSLLAIADHASVAPALLACYELRQCSDADAACKSECFHSLDSATFKRCDTTPEVALLSYDALRVGNYAGFRTSLPYMTLRSLLEETGFLVSKPSPKCVRTQSISDAITCPDGHLKKSESDIARGCSTAGLDCYGFECICSPCVKVVDVDMFPIYLGVFGGLLFVCAAMICILARRRAIEDSVWIVKKEDIVFHDPPRILGVGTFGFVLHAEYLGTQVAVKRVIPPKDICGTRGKCNSQRFITEERGQWYRTHCNFPMDNYKNFDFDHTAQSEDIIAPMTDRDLLQSVWLRRSMRPKGGSKVMSRLTSPGTKRYSELRRKFMDEVRILSKVRHPNITTIMGAVVAPDSDPMLIMEFMQLGSLYDMLHNQAIILDEDAMHPILRDVAKGLRFLHSANPQILHCDVKAQNILIDTGLRAKISDFGLSMKKSYFGIQVAGSPYFLSPELLRGETSNTTCSDVYAFGILMYEALSRKDPYEGEDFCHVLTDVANDNIRKRPPVPEACSNDVAALMKACLLADPEHRPTARELDVRLQAIVDESTTAGSGMDSLTSPKRQVETEALIKQLFPKNVADALTNGRKVEAETHEEVTIFFSDIVGYTSIASSLSPTKVSTMLDRLFTKLDKLCDIHKMFKVETIGDAFMCAANLAEKQPDHLSIVARFALDAIAAASDTLIDLDDPSRGHIQLHAGFHTGPVVTNVVGSRRPRYSVIGDTVNVAARMESTSLPDHIQCSEFCAHALKGQAEFMLERRGSIEVKGRGEMVTYWVWSGPGRSMLQPALPVDNSNVTRESIINWSTDVLKGILTRILIMREASLASKPRKAATMPSLAISADAMKHVAKVGFILPEFNVAAAVRKQHFGHVTVSEPAVKALKHYITAVAHMYRGLPFHNFERASFVAMNVTKLLSALTQSERKFNSRSEAERVMHEASFGLSSDPIAEFAIIFASLVHNVAHPGIAVDEDDDMGGKSSSDLASVYGEQSASQLNAIDLSFQLLMDPQYDALRGTIYQTVEELKRFRSIVICCVLATDTSNKEMKALRTARWEQAAFGETPTEEKASREISSLRATALTEHIMEASSVMHAFQQWAVYRKWNERYYQESRAIANPDRLGASDPAMNMYDRVIQCFEGVVLPLGNRIREAGVLGETWNVFLSNAVENFKIWVKSGHELTNQMTTAPFRTTSSG